MRSITATPPDPLDRDAAKGTPQHHADGAVSREEAHDLHRRHRQRLMLAAQHAILDRLILVGEAWAPDFDDLPPGPSGNRTYIGTAFLDLRRRKLIRTTGDGPHEATEGGRHSNYLHRWQIRPGAKIEKFRRDHPIPPDDDNAVDGYDTHQ